MNSGGQLDLGTLSVKIAADYEAMRRDLAKATTELEKTKNGWEKHFEDMGGGLGRVGERIGRVGEAFKKLFGDDATAIGQKFGKDLADAFSLSEEQVKGLGQAVKGLQGAFQIAGQSVQLLMTPLGKAAALVAFMAAVPTIIGKVGGFDGQKAFSTGFDALWASAFGSDADKRELWLRGVNESRAEQGRSSVEERARELLEAEKAGSLAPEDMAALATIRQNAPERVWNPEMSQTATKFESATDKFKGSIDQLLAKVTEWMAPGQSKGDKEKGKNDADKAAKERERAAKDKQKADAEEWDDFWKKQDESRQKSHNLYVERQKAEEKWLKDSNASMEKYWDDREKTDKAVIDGLGAAMVVQAKKINEDVEAQFAKWQNIGSGRFGSANKVGGLGGTALDMVGSATAGGTRYFGAGLQGAAQGSQTGNPWGVLVGAIIGLLTQSEGFAKVLKSLDAVLEPIVQFLGSIIGSFSGVLEQIGSIVGIILNGIAPTLWSIQKPLNFIAGVLSAVAAAWAAVAYALTWATNKVQHIIADLVGYLSEDFAKQIMEVGFTDEQVAAMKGQFEKAVKTYQEWDWYGEDSLETLASSTDRAAASLQQFSDAALNAAPGYKLGLAVFNSAMGIGQAGYGPSGSVSTYGLATGGGQQVTINVYGGGAREIAHLVRGELTRGGQTGAAVTMRTPAFAGGGL